MPSAGHPVLSSCTDDDPATKCEQLCAAGDGGSCDALGTRHYLGRGAVLDAIAAMQYARKACALNNGSGCWHATYLQYYGEGTPKDVAAARITAEKACRLESWDACNLLGVMLDRGEGTREDPYAATSMFARACEHETGDGTWCRNYAHSLRMGRGTAKRPEEARALMAKACSWKNNDACFDLATMLADGEGGTPDRSRAAALATELCEHDYARGCLLAAKLVPGDLEKYYKKGCEQDLGLSCGRLALHYLTKTPPDSARARPLLVRACELGQETTCGLYADLVLGGGTFTRTDHDDADLLELLKRVCARGMQQACERAARMTFFVDPSKPFTRSVAGFPFGIDAGAAGRLCASAKGQWLEGTACTEQPVRSFPWAQIVSTIYCRGKLCEISATRLGADAQQIESATKLISDKYGSPSYAEGASTAAAFAADCARGARAEYRRTWYFKRPNFRVLAGRVLVAANCEPGEPSVLSVIYQDEAGLARRQEEAAKVNRNY